MAVRLLVLVGLTLSLTVRGIATVVPTLATSPTCPPRNAATPPAACAAAMDAFCNGVALAQCRATVVAKGGSLPLFPLHDTDSKGSPAAWRCYSGSALNANLSQYNTSANSPLYCSEDAGLQRVLVDCTNPVELVLLEQAAREQGAVCLDGSPPAVCVLPPLPPLPFSLSLSLSLPFAQSDFVRARLPHGIYRGRVSITPWLHCDGMVLVMEVDSGSVCVCVCVVCV
jgi:hypothetical protein